MTIDNQPPHLSAVNGGGADAVKVPAIGLIVTGALGTLSSIVGAIQSMLATDMSKAAIDQVAAQDPKLTEANRQAISGMFDTVMKAIAAANFVCIALGVLALIGGISMLKRSNRGLAMAGAISACLIVANFCCVLGLVFGIWSLVVLVKPEVKATFS